MLRSSEPGRGSYDCGSGTMRRRKLPTKGIVNVATANKRSRSEVLSGKANDDIDAKKKALRPNADRGKAVAVPRLSGQFRAAEDVSL